MGTGQHWLDILVQKKEIRRLQESLLLSPQGLECARVCAQVQACRQHRLSEKHQQWLQLFSLSGSWKFVAINILVPLTKVEIKTSLLL